MTVGDISQAIKFAVRQIEALEADDYACLPGVTFVRGAVRSYAKFLKLDEASLLALLDTAAPAAPPDVRPPQNMGVATAAVGLRQLSPIAVLSVLLAVVAMVIGGWHLLGGGQLPAVTADVPAPTPPAPDVVQPVMPPQAVVEPAPAESPTPPVQPDTQAQQTAAPLPQGGAAVRVQQVAAPTSAVQPAVAPPADGSRQLVFVFGEKSWIEVKEAGGRIIFTGEQPAGSRQAVAGKPPFQLVIGNAGKVQVFDGDRQIDIQPFIRAEVARLTLQ